MPLLKSPLTSELNFQGLLNLSAWLKLTLLDVDFEPMGPKPFELDFQVFQLAALLLLLSEVALLLLLL